MAVDKIRQYLLPLNIPNEDKRYVLNFCKKIEYLEGLRKQAADETGERVELGYGDANSRICFIFRNKREFQAIKKVLQSHLDEFSLNLWQIWITFVDKTPSEYANKYTLLAHEMNAINPTVVYVFGDNQEVAAEAEQVIRQVGCSNLKHYFFVDFEVFSKDDVESKKILWPQFRYLINYQTLDIKK